MSQNASIYSFEIIIVDDASSDGTVSFLEKKYQTLIQQGYIRVISLVENIGVTGAKNKGFDESKGEWVIFLDSDDFLVDNCFNDIEFSLNNNVSFPIVFFRCIDETGRFVGVKFDSDKVLNLVDYLHNISYGEALTAINKGIVKERPYISILRGYEGLGCTRIIKKYNKALLSTIIARVYVKDHADRLSLNAGFYKRMPLLARGHLIMIKEFGKNMGIKKSFNYFVKACCYFVLGNLYKIFKRE
jgi:glycosyltransferase involved in cell wall biosynthesis